MTLKNSLFLQKLKMETFDSLYETVYNAKIAYLAYITVAAFKVDDKRNILFDKMNKTCHIWYNDTPLPYSISANDLHTILKEINFI